MTAELARIEAYIRDYEPSPEVQARRDKLNALGMDGHAAVVSDFTGLMCALADWSAEARLIAERENAKEEVR